MKQRWYSLLLAMVILTFPFGLALYQLGDTDELARELRRESIVEQASMRLDTELRSTQASVQIRRLIGDLVRFLDGQLWERDGAVIASGVAKFHGDRMQPGLPRHDFFLVELASGTARMRWQRQGLKALPSSQVALDMARWAGGDDSIAESLAASLSRALEYPIAANPVQRRIWKGDSRFIASIKGRRMMTWEILPGHTTPSRWFLWTIVDLTGTGPRFGARRLAEDWPVPHSGIAFLPTRAGFPLIYSEFIRDRPDLVRRLKQAVHGRPRLPPVTEEGDVLLCTGSDVPEFPFRAVLATSWSEDAGGAGKRSWLVWILGVIWALAMFLLVERFVFGRGPAFTVRVQLMGTFIMVALLPLVGAFGLGRRFIADRERAERRLVAAGLSEDLQRLDGGSRNYHARLVQRMRAISHDPAKIAKIQELERRIAASPETRENHPLAVDFLRSLVQELVHGQHSRDLPNSLLLVGLDGFQAQWDKLNPETTGSEGSKPLPNVMAIMVRDYVSRLFVNLKGRDKRPLAGRSEITREANIKETFLNSVRENLGPGAFSSFFHFPLGVAELELDQTRFYRTSVLCLVEGLSRYALSWIWTEGIVDLPYLEATLRDPNDRNLRGFPNVFAMETFRNLRSGDAGWDSIPPGLANLQQLVSLAQGTRDLRTPLRRFVEAEKRVYEARPGRFANRFVLAGFRSIEHLTRDTAVQEEYAGYLVLVMLLFALAVAIRSTEHVLEPLRELLRGMVRIREGDYSFQLQTSRTDEFGALAQAFNRMAVKLQEGKLLGRFVSSSVQKAVDDAAFQAQAHAGMSTGVTVLFSSLMGFEAVEADSPPDEVFATLEGHLDAVNRGVRQHGGEIDKVMGDKILVLFPHESFGGGEAAVAAALAVVRDVRADLRTRMALKPAMGINSGQAIFGIVGARTVRLDFTAIGDTVNLAARLATLAQTTTGTRVVISGAVVGLAGPQTRVERLPFKQVKGKTQEVEAYLLLDN